MRLISASVVESIVVLVGVLFAESTYALTFRGRRNGTTLHLEKLFVINLRYRTDRWAWTSAEFHKQGLSPTRVEAVSGKELLSLVRSDSSPSLADWNTYFRNWQAHAVPRHTKLAPGSIDSKLVRTDYNISWLAQRVPGYNASKQLVLSPGEVGCILSHLNLWRRIAEASPSADRGISCIFEDDVQLAPGFSGSMQKLLAELPGRTDLLYLSYADLDAKHDMNFSRHLFVPSLLVVTQAYCLTASGAAALLRRLPVEGALDVWMAQQFPSLRTFAAWPKLARQHDEVGRGDSDIEHTANSEAKLVKGDIEPMARWWGAEDFK